MPNSVKAVISGTGLWKPEHVITNEELVTAYNGWAERYNQQHAAEIQSGGLAEKPLSSAAFIEKASGIKQRYAYIKDGILDIDRMCPRIPSRADDELSDQAEMALHAARDALQAANKTAADIDAVIVSCAYTQRSYPALAIEVQHALGIEGFAFDMLVACSAATFALHRAREMVLAGSARAVLVINPELTSPQVNYCDRDSHFIFGDVSTAVVVERDDQCSAEHSFDILGARAVTSYSNNIRSNFGFVNRANDGDPYAADRLFVQQGRNVFKEVCPMAAAHISDHLAATGVANADVKRWWLHQANINMNHLIGKKLIGHMPEQDEAPIILDEFANTASAGSIIAFHQYHKDMQGGDHGLLCSFGAGYSIGSLVLQKR